MQPPAPIDPEPTEDGPEPTDDGPDLAAQRAVLVGASVVLYLGMYLLAVYGNHHWLDQPVAFLELADGFTWEALRADGEGAAIGLVAGLLACGLMRVPVIANLHFMLEIKDELARVLGRCDLQQAFLLALLSSVGEEALFRGVLQNLWGLWIAAAVFGLIHYYGRRLWYYPAIAFAMGLVFGGLYQWTGVLAAPLACHFTINLINLRALGQHAAELGLD